MNVTSNINKYLVGKGIRKSYVAERTGITANALNLSLNGKRKLFIDEYVRICDVLEVPYDYFITFQDTVLI